MVKKRKNNFDIKIVLAVMALIIVSVAAYFIYKNFMLKIEVTFTDLPESIKLVVDGDDYDNKRIIKLSPGEHTVELVNNEGKIEYDTKVNVDKTSNEISLRNIYDVCEVSFNVPRGTSIYVNSEKVYGDKVNLKPGDYKLVLEHPILEYSYNQDLKVTKAGKVDIISEMKLKDNTDVIVKNSCVGMLNNILKQACESNKLNLDASIYSKNADTNKILTEAYIAMKKFANKKNINTLLITDINKCNYKLSSKDGMAQITAECFLTGLSVDGEKIEYSLKVNFDIDGSRLIVDSVDTFIAEQVDK